MNTPTSLPDWLPTGWLSTDWLQSGPLPWWGVLLVLLPAVLFLLAFLAMPFSVLGLKSRLEAIEERLDEIQGEVRALSLRLPERGEAPVPIPPMATRPMRPPVEEDDPPPSARRPPIPQPPQRPRRNEPRVDWPR